MDNSLLPPLPPIPGEEGGKSAYLPAGRSIVAILIEQHGELDRVLSELDNSSHPRRAAIDLMTASATRHLSSEQQYLHPVYKSLLADGKQVAAREITRDQALLRQLQQLAKMDTEAAEFSGLVKEICEGMRQHTHNADTDLLPRLKQSVSEADLIRLGNRVEIAQEAAPSRPHPDAPLQTPAVKVAAPLLGAVDKVRDVVEGRTTYPPSEKD